MKNIMVWNIVMKPADISMKIGTVGNITIRYVLFIQSFNFILPTCLKVCKALELHGEIAYVGNITNRDMLTGILEACPGVVFLSQF